MDWQTILKTAIEEFITQEVKEIDTIHVAETPDRVARAWSEFVSGYAEDPKLILAKTFDDSSGYDGMVHVRDIPVLSMCAHHILPIFGKAHFAYIPHGRVVGLSKIPRFIDALCRRLQIQEHLCEQIVDIFQETVGCDGCAVHIVAAHFCMISRGVRADHDIITETTSLRGCFKKRETREEFMTSLSRNVRIL